MSKQDKKFDYWDSVEQWPRWLRGDCPWFWKTCLGWWACCWLGYHLRVSSSMHSPSINDVDVITCWLSVVRCALALPKESDNWRRSTIFQTLTKISDKNYRVKICSSWINVIDANMGLNLGWMMFPILNHIKCLWRRGCLVRGRSEEVVIVPFGTWE